MELRRWPRKNDPDSIRARQESSLPASTARATLRPRYRDLRQGDGSADRRRPRSGAVVGPIDIELGEYELEEPEARVVERGRAQRASTAPRQPEGGLSISLYRARAPSGESGGFRPTSWATGSRARPPPLRRRGAGRRFADGSRGSSTTCAPGSSRSRSEPVQVREARELETHVVGPMCHVMYAFTTGDACGMNMITRTPTP